MKDEILAAVMFLVRFIEKSETFPRDKLENFKNILTTLLTQRFEKHWFPEVPAKGQGYRCIRVNVLNPVDMTLEKAAEQCGLRYRDLRLPTELTVWVDPNEVCYRLGESEGSYCTLATFPSDSTSPSSSPSSSPTSEEKMMRRPLRNNRYDAMKYHQHRGNINMHILPPTSTTIPASVLTSSSLSPSSASLSSTTSSSSASSFSNSTSAAAALRMRPVNFNLTASNRPHPQWRCDRQSYHHPPPATAYHHHNHHHYSAAANRYMQRNYKNILTV